MRTNGLAPLPEWEEGTIEAFRKQQVEQDLKRERERMRHRVVPCSNTTCDDEAVLSRIKYAQIPRMYDIWGAPVLDSEPNHHVFRCPTCGWATKRKGNGNARNN